MQVSRFAAPARRWTVPLLVSFAVVIGGCGSDDDDPPATPPAATTGAPVADATLNSGTLSVATDAQGRATLNGVAAGATSSLAIQVLSVGATQTVNAASDGTVTVPGSSAQVTLPANGFVVEGGGAYTSARSVITVTRLMIGTYTCRVHNYSGTYAPGLTGSTVRVEARINGATAVYTPPAGEAARTTDAWTVFSFAVDA